MHQMQQDANLVSYKYDLINLFGSLTGGSHPSVSVGQGRRVLL